MYKRCTLITILVRQIAVYQTLSWAYQETTNILVHYYFAITHLKTSIIAVGPFEVSFNTQVPVICESGNILHPLQAIATTCGTVKKKGLLKLFKPGISAVEPLHQQSLQNAQDSFRENCSEKIRSCGQRIKLLRRPFLSCFDRFGEDATRKCRKACAQWSRPLATLPASYSPVATSYLALIFFHCCILNLMVQIDITAIELYSAESWVHTPQPYNFAGTDLILLLVDLFLFQHV